MEGCAVAPPLPPTCTALPQLAPPSVGVSLLSDRAPSFLLTVMQAVREALLGFGPFPEGLEFGVSQSRPT